MAGGRLAAYRRGMSERALSDADLRVLLGVVAKLESLMAVGGLDTQAIEAFGLRLARDGVLAGHPNERNVRQSLADLTQRIQFALGAYDAPPPSLPVDDVS